MIGGVGNMESITFFICVLCFTSISVQAANVTVSVYYETLCPDSISFLKDQFYPAYDKYLRDKITVNLIPFGKAIAEKEDGKWSFDCQHGAKECYGNKVHGCAIDVAPNNASIKFIVCSMSTANPSDTYYLKKCAADNNINWSSIENCLNSGKGDELLAMNGERTSEVKPDITFIPTIVFNDVYKEPLQTLALKGFKETVELLLEDTDCPECPSSSSTTAFSLILLLLPLISIYKMY